MTDTSTDTPTRVFIAYVDDEGGEVSLPGYLDATPSVVSPGDVFSVPADLLERDPDAVLALVSDPRFAEAEEPADPLERQTVAELLALLGMKDAGGRRKAELITLARDRARMFPPVPGEQVSDAAAEVPIPGQDVDTVDETVDESDPADPGEGETAGDAGSSGEEPTQ